MAINSPFSSIISTVNKKNIFISFICVLVFSAIFFINIFLHPTEMLYPSNDIRMYAVSKLYLQEQFKFTKIIPLWDPYLFGGGPFLANPQSAVFSPLHVLFFLFPVESLFGYLFFIDTVFIGVCTYLFAKTIRLNSFGSFIAAACMVGCPIILIRVYPGHIFLIDAFMYFPLLLTSYELLMIKKKFHYAFFSGIILGCMFLTGMAQIALYGLVIGSFFLFFRVVLSIRKIKLKELIKIIVFYSLSIVIGVLLSSVQLLPSLEFSKLAVRGNGVTYDFASSYSLHPFQILSSVIPHFFGTIDGTTYWGKGNFWENCIYVGLLPLLLAGFGISRFRNKYVFVFTIILFISVLLSFGRYTPLFYFFYRYIPEFNMFRIPTRFIFFYAFSISVLAGFGIDYIVTLYKANKLNNLYKYITCITFLTLLFSALVFLNVQTIRNLTTLNSVAKYFNHINLEPVFLAIKKDLLNLMFFITSFFLLYTLLKKEVISLKLFKIFIVVLVFCDLWLFSNQFFETKNPADVFSLPTSIRQLSKEKEQFRTFDFSGRLMAQLARNHIQTLTGFDPTYLRDYRDFLWLSGQHIPSEYESFFQFSSIDNMNILKLLNTKYIISNKPLLDKNLELLSSDTYLLYKISNTLPRAYMVPNARIEPDKQKMYSILKQSKFDIKNEILLDKDYHTKLENNSNYQEAKIITYNPNNIKLKIQTSDAGYLVLSENWYPGWKAYDNGKEKVVLRADSLFRSVYLEKGNHTVVFAFDPLSYKLGKSITLITVVICCIYAIWHAHKSIWRS